MTTVLDTIDNKRVILPNKTVFNSKIVNFVANPTRMVELVFSVDYDTSISFAKKVILDVIKKNKEILLAPEPFLRLITQNNSSLDIRCKVWTATANYFDVLCGLNEDVLETFKINNINIPFNQLQLSYRKEAGNEQNTIAKASTNSKKAKEII